MLSRSQQSPLHQLQGQSYISGHIHFQLPAVSAGFFRFLLFPAVSAGLGVKDNSETIRKKRWR
jgi:hypothetical protein